jgi:uncharacterized protein
MFRKVLLGLALAVLASPAAADLRRAATGGDKIRVLIIDGQNNHDWRSTTPFMKKALEESGRFTVQVATSPERPKTPQKPKDKDQTKLEKYEQDLAAFKKANDDYQQAMTKFHPDLTKVDVVLSNYNGDLWPKSFQKELEDSLKAGKIGLVIVHAANNSFGGWNEYLRMVGMGWYGREKGDRLLLDDSGQAVRIPKGEGDGPGHRYSGQFVVTIRDNEHPVTKGMPNEWMHNNDELYDNMRGPIENIRLLATAYSKGTKAHEPMIWTISYGKGRVFHTPMGHDVNGMRCIGFITTLRRGTEWAATGQVTQPIPSDFPTADKTSTVPAAKKTK